MNLKLRWYAFIVANICCIHAIAQDNTNKSKAASPGYQQVNARANATSNNWKTYTAKTINKLPGFKIKADPALNNYGGWKINQSTATGFFRVEKKADRWWIVDPEGYPFIHKGVAVFRPGNSDLQKEALQKIK